MKVFFWFIIVVVIFGLIGKCSDNDDRVIPSTKVQNMDRKTEPLNDNQIKTSMDKIVFMESSAGIKKMCSTWYTYSGEENIEKNRTYYKNMSIKNVSISKIDDMEHEYIVVFNFLANGSAKNAKISFSKNGDVINCNLKND